MYAIFDKTVNDFVKTKDGSKTLIMEYSNTAKHVSDNIGNCFVVVIRDLEDYKLELDYHIQEINETIERLTYGNKTSTSRTC